MPIRGVCHACPQPYLLGVLGPPGQQLKRVRRDGHFKGVMLCCPDHFKSGPIGHLHHLKGMIPDLRHIGAVVHSLKINCQMKFHIFLP